MKYILFLISLISIIQAAPARGGYREFKQDNGHTFIAQAKGNQHLNWIESADGEILKYNPDTKNYELAQIKDNELKPSGIKYEDGIKKTKSLKSIHDDVYKLWAEKQHAHSLRMEYKKR